MNDKVLQTLQYDQLLNLLSEHAACSLGKRKAELLRPSPRFQEVERRLKETDEAVLVVRLKGNPPFGGITDITPAVQRAAIGGMLNTRELLDTANTLYGGRMLKQFLGGIHSDHEIPSLHAYFSQIVEHREVEQKIRSCISDQGEIVDHASPELARIRQALRAGEGQIRDRLEQMIRTPSVQKMLQEQLITIRNDRFVIPVKQEYRSHFGGIIHDQSASGATLFIEPEAVVQLNNKLRELKLKEEKEIEKILRELSGLVGAIADSLKINLQMLAELDFIFAKAGLAYAMKATLPRINDRGWIKLKQARHPLIPAEIIVPIDVELGSAYTAVIITGPNTGGKTVTLKTVGLLALMAMSGLFIPAAEDSEVGVFDHIFADIGDEQSIEQNLSTFSGHLTNIIHILREMTPNSLILLDELGAGTDPAEGSALAMAILEHMLQSGCRLIATTHYSELKAYAYEREGVINASMEFDIATLSPTYRLLIGVPGRSNAFAIAERLGLPRNIIEQARSRVNEENKKVESMIASLETNRATAEAERAEAERLRREIESLRDELAEQKKSFAKQKEKLLAKAEQEARELVRKARAEAEEIVRELRKMALEEKASLKEHKLIAVKGKLNEVERQIAQTDNNSSPPHRKIRVNPGDAVFVKHVGQKGHVVEKVNDDEVIVQLGILKMKVRTAELEPIEQKSGPPPVSFAAVRRPVDAPVRNELDLRGVTAEEALIQTDKFLDEAILSNLGQVYIIHGKGTGALRSVIHEFLRNHKQVKRFRLGEMGEGGSGVTVAEL